MPTADTAPSALDLERHRPHLMKFARLQLRDESAAEDAVQETLLAALQGRERFAGQSSVRTWLIGILKHKIIDHIRRRSREQLLEPLADELDPDGPRAYFQEDGHFLEPPQQWQDPDQALQQHRFFEALERCLEALPKNSARVFTMREVMGMETGEICKEVGITPTNCWVLLHRARVSLRACLEKNWFSGGAPTIG